MLAASVVYVMGIFQLFLNNDLLVSIHELWMKPVPVYMNTLLIYLYELKKDWKKKDMKNV